MPYRLVDPSRSPRLRTFLHVVGGIATAILVLGGVFLAVTTYELVEATRATQIDNTQRNEDTKSAAENAARSAARIEDCTTPGRPCFDDGQRRLARTVGSINDYALAAAACADQPLTQTVDEIQACILRLIKAER